MKNYGRKSKILLDQYVKIAVRSVFPDVTNKYYQQIFLNYCLYKLPVSVIDVGV